MVKETRIVFEAKDIVGVRVSCQHERCGGTAVYVPSDSHPLPDECPFCRKPWTQEEREYPLRSLVVALNTIANWPDSGENALKVKAQFELDGGADG